MGAQGGAIRAGRAFVELFADDSRLVRGLKQAETRLRGYGYSVGRMAAGVLAAGSALSAPFIASATMAANAEAAMSRLRAVFGDNATAAEDFAASLAKATGTSKFDIIEQLGRFGGVLKGKGFDSSAVVQLSQDFATLLQDFAAFNNLSPDDAMGKFLSVLSGESEAVDQFGFELKEAALEAELLAMGINKSVQQASEQEKTLARLGVLGKAMRSQGATGAAARSAELLTGQYRRMMATIRDTSVVVGQALVPVLHQVANVLSMVLQRVVEFITTLDTRVIVSVASVAAGMVALSGVMFSLSAALYGLASVARVVAVVFTVITTLIGAMLTPIGLLVAMIGGATAAWFAWTEAGQQAASAVSTTIGNTLAFIREWISAIASAIMAGDLAAAGQILAKTLEVAFRGVVAAVGSAWSWVTDRAVAGFNTIIAIAAQLGQVVVSVLRGMAKAFGFTGETLAKLENHLAAVSAHRDKLAADALTREHAGSAELARASAELQALVNARNQQQSESTPLPEFQPIPTPELPQVPQPGTPVPESDMRTVDEMLEDLKKLSTTIDGGVEKAAAELRDARTGAAARRLAGVVGVDKSEKQVAELAAIHGRMDELVTLARRSRLVFTGDLV